MQNFEKEIKERVTDEIVEILKKEEIQLSEAGKKDINYISINGIDVDVKKLDFSRLEEEHKNAIISFQNRLLEDEWVDKEEVNKYWRESVQDMYDIKDYKFEISILKEDFFDEWDDLAYYIKRGRVEQVKDECGMSQDFTKRTKFRANGDMILHICAEFN